MILTVGKGTRSSLRISAYAATLFFSLHYATTLYINSSFLEQYFPSTLITALYIAGALGGIWLFMLAPSLLKKFQNKTLLIIFILLEAVAIGGLSYAASPAFIALLFILYGSVSMMIYYCIDLFLERASSDKTTGETRGIHLTLMNTAIASAPLLVAFLAPHGEFSRVYTASALILLPLLLIAAIAFKDTVEPRDSSRSAFLLLRHWKQLHDVRNVTIVRFILEFFFTIMVIYTPVYLNSILGFEWKEIGIIFTIMLLPFIFFEYPLGKIADRFLGEKEIMTAGLFITGAALLTLPFLPITLVAWSTALFFTRVGASFIEVTTESYFFKQIGDRDHDLISIFRLVRPLALIAGSVAGLAAISVVSYEAMFLVLAVVLFYGMIQSLRIKDTL